MNIFEKISHSMNVPKVEEAQKHDYSTTAYAKVNLKFNQKLFIKEYDEHILPAGIPISNSQGIVYMTSKLNEIWGMVPPDVYDTGDVWVQPGSAATLKYITRERPCWIMTQLMELDTSTVKDPLMIRWASVGGPSIRNETLAPEYKWNIKPQFKNLKIWKWIQTLPFTKINSLHCVSIEPGGFAVIHRDMKGFYDSNSSAGVSRVFNQGYVIMTINISDGGGPLWWALDGEDCTKPYQANDPVYLTNDYFMHAVPIMTSRRRQLRITGIPTPELWDMVDHSTRIDIGPNYKFDSTYLSREGFGKIE
jgi:hypothetical protein